MRVSKTLIVRLLVAALSGTVLAALALSVLVLWLMVTEPVALASALHARDIYPVLRALMR